MINDYFKKHQTLKSLFKDKNQKCYALYEGLTKILAFRSYI